MAGKRNRPMGSDPVTGTRDKNDPESVAGAYRGRAQGEPRTQVRPKMHPRNGPSTDVREYGNRIHEEYRAAEAVGKRASDESLARLEGFDKADGDVIEVKDSTIIGAHRSNIRRTDATPIDGTRFRTVSHEHVLFTHDRSGWHVKNVSQSNSPVYVCHRKDGDRLELVEAGQSTRLDDGDLLGVGATYTTAFHVVR